MYTSKAVNLYGNTSIFCLQDIIFTDVTKRNWCINHPDYICFAIYSQNFGYNLVCCRDSLSFIIVYKNVQKEVRSDSKIFFGKTRDELGIKDSKTILVAFSFLSFNDIFPLNFAEDGFPEFIVVWFIDVQIWPDFMILDHSVPFF